MFPSAGARAVAFMEQYSKQEHISLMRRFCGSGGELGHQPSVCSGEKHFSAPVGRHRPDCFGGRTRLQTACTERTTSSLCLRQAWLSAAALLHTEVCVNNHLVPTHISASYTFMFSASKYHKQSYGSFMLADFPPLRGLKQSETLAVRLQSVLFMTHRSVHFNSKLKVQWILREGGRGLLQSPQSLVASSSG